jgi:hypothetical protein
MTMYELELYYDCHLYGLADTATADNADDMKDKAHELINEGGFLVIRNTVTGEEVTFSTTEYYEKIYFEGEVDIDI